jgi:hypothetical protein
MAGHSTWSMRHMYLFEIPDDTPGGDRSIRGKLNIYTRQNNSMCEARAIKTSKGFDLNPGPPVLLELEPCENLG